MRKIFNDPAHQEQFIEKGYVILPLLPQEQVDFILQALETMRPHDNFAPADRRSDYHCTFLDTNETYKREANQLIADVFNPYLEKALHQFRILNGNFYIKQPGKGRFEIHQNWMHVEDIRDTTLTIWCPLVDVDRTNGALEIVPGSHKIVPDVAAVNVDYYFRDFEDALIEKYLQPVPLKAGEGIIFDDSLIHYSGQNNSDKPRYAIQIETLPQEVQPVIYHFDKAQPEKGFELFEVDFDFFISENAYTMRNRPERLKSRGFVPNPNRILTEAEFVEKLQNGNAIRAEIYAQTVAV